MNLLRFILPTLLTLAVPGVLIYITALVAPPFVAISSAAIFAAWLGYPLYLQIRVHLLRENEQKTQFKVFSFLASNIVFSAFFQLALAPLVIMVFFLNSGLMRLKAHLPRWLNNACPGILEVISWFTVLVACVLSFRAARWVWKQQQEDSKGKVSGARSDG